MAVALVALDAVVHVTGPQGERRVPIEEFHKLPGATPHIETAVQNGELITHVTLPKSSVAQRSAYVKLRDRASYEFALASAAVAVDLSGSTIREVRVVLGGIATKPWRSHEAEQALTGAQSNADTFRAAAEAALKSAKPLRHNAFKIELAKMALVRALNHAVQS
jgi:xanthine dehydrogenase YagS FAD-binding subunit